MSMTYEEMLAAETELAHFNDKHDKLGRFTRKLGGSVSSTSNSMSPRGKEIAKKAGKAAGVAAGVSALATVGNAISAQKGLDMMGYGDKLSGSAVAKAGAVKAGKVAAATALAVIGGHMVADYMRKDALPKKKTDGK